MSLTIHRIFELILYILPAYFANGAPVIFGGGKPLDLGKNFLDGRRIFGDNKTIRGLVFGILSGFLIGFILLGLEALSLLHSDLISLCNVIVLPIGTHVGDLFGSFVKRRVNISPGKSAPVLDQLGFLIFALLFSWLICGTVLGFWDLVVLVVLTLLLHPLTNIGAYILKLKKVPY